MTKHGNLESAYRLARELYASVGVDVDTTLERLQVVEISVHCWQGDEVVGCVGTAVALRNGRADTVN